MLGTDPAFHTLQLIFNLQSDVKGCGGWRDALLIKALASQSWQPESNKDRTNSTTLS